LAAARLQGIAPEGHRPFTDLVADCRYGNSPDFGDAVEAGVGVTAVVAPSAETRCGLPRPLPMDTTSPYQGEVRAKRSVGAAAPSPCTVAPVAARRRASRGYQRTVSEGTKGPSTDAVARQRVPLCKEGLPARRVWRVIQRTWGAEPTDADALRNAPVSPPLRTGVWLSGLRGAGDQCCEDGQTALGMAPYEVRT
jgi:hypothetical protein